MLSLPRHSPLIRTLVLALTGLGLPLLWPGVLRHLFDLSGPMTPMHSDAPRALTVLQVGSDALIGVAYTVIAGLLCYVVYRNRNRLPFDWVVLAFGLFIVACGLTHVMHIVTRFLPIMWLDGYLKAITAVVSVATAAALPPLVPRIARLIEADERATRQQHELEHANQRLQQALHDTEVLFALSSTLERARNVDDVFREASVLLADSANVDGFVLWTIQGDHARITHWQGSIDVSGTAFFNNGIDRKRGSLWDAIDHRAARYIDETATFPGVLHERLQLNVNALAHLPLQTATGTMYALSCLRRASTAWTARERRLLEAAAKNIAVALERQHTSELLEAAARTDALTGLGNRRAFDEALDAVINSSKRHLFSVSVLSLDLDGLKGVNDQGGHAQGDRYLTTFARAMRSALRREDTLYRVGGDEFMAILPHTGPEGSQGVLLRVREAVLEVHALGFDRADVSAWIAVYPVEAGTLEELVRLSDERLYQNKRQHHRERGAGRSSGHAEDQGEREH
ncbi:diguanylate cyclase domain-containing protein [Deinococcus altitudinis]|uniref:sensor domain-containing diguanylate cyclase n=1 Tax=Deinococcus altitudinis TaxID=468914 RepID=UPI003892BC82